MITEINRHEAKRCSQNGEDGILEWIFTQIGITNRIFLEIGTGNGYENNTLDLLLNHEWAGMWIEPQDLTNPDLKGKPLKHEKILATPQNVNQICIRNKITGRIDLASIDVDGNDFWIWRALSMVIPRVMVIEYNPSLDPGGSISVKYHDEFDRFAFDSTGFYHGASLAAFCNLADRKGYALVGCDKTGTNAFFVLRSELKGDLRAVPPATAYFPLVQRHNSGTPQVQFERIKHLEFERI